MEGNEKSGLTRRSRVRWRDWLAGQGDLHDAIPMYEKEMSFTNVLLAAKVMDPLSHIMRVCSPYKPAMPRVRIFRNV